MEYVINLTMCHVGDGMLYTTTHVLSIAYTHTTFISFASPDAFLLVNAFHDIDIDSDADGNGNGNFQSSLRFCT